MENLLKSIKIWIIIITVIKDGHIIPQKGGQHNEREKERPQSERPQQSHNPDYGHHPTHNSAGHIDRQAA